MKKEEIRIATRRYLGIRDTDTDIQIDRMIDRYIKSGYSDPKYISILIKRDLGIK